MLPPDLRLIVFAGLRWARTVKTLKPLEHTLSLVTHPLPPLLLLVAASPTLWAANLIALTLVLRVALHCVMARRFSPAMAVPPWLVPIGECLCFAVLVLEVLGTAAGSLRKRAAEAA
jgi:ceramide glucosyltransferase